MTLERTISDHNSFLPSFSDACEREKKESSLFSSFLDHRRKKEISFLSREICPQNFYSPRNVKDQVRISFIVISARGKNKVNARFRSADWGFRCCSCCCLTRLFFFFLWLRVFFLPKNEQQFKALKLRIIRLPLDTKTNKSGRMKAVLLSLHRIHFHHFILDDDAPWI